MLKQCDFAKVEYYKNTKITRTQIKHLLDFAFHCIHVPTEF